MNDECESGIKSKVNTKVTKSSIDYTVLSPNILTPYLQYY